MPYGILPCWKFVFVVWKPGKLNKRLLVAVTFGECGEEIKQEKLFVIIFKFLNLRGI